MVVVNRVLAEYLLELPYRIFLNLLFEFQLVRLAFQNLLGLENLCVRDRLFDTIHRFYRY